LIKKAEDTRLRSYIQKLRYNGESKVRVTPKRMRDFGSGIFQLVLIGIPDIRDIGQEENRSEEQDYYGDCHVGNIQCLVASAVAMSVFRVKEKTACDGSQNPTNPVARLGQIDADGCVLRVPKHGDVGIRDGLKKGETRGDDTNTQ
jgi:hypothetical protein